jgi:hypothetical protein
MQSMPLRIRVSDSRCADELLAYLRNLGADVRREGECVTVRRRHPVVAGEPPTQDRMELEFIVRVWAAERPGTAFEVEEAA